MMKHKGFLTGIFGVLLVFGLVLAGCGGGGSGGGGSGDSGSGDSGSGDSGSGGDGEFGETLTLEGTVSITGTPMVGQTLTADTDSLEGEGTISYEWKRSATDAEAGNRTAIGGNSSTYAVAEVDKFNYITVTVRRAGYDGEKTSAASAKVEASGTSALAGSVSIDGDPTVGQTLTANTDSLNGSGDISYAWKRAGTPLEALAELGTPIPGATSKTYTLDAADLGKYITVTVIRDGLSGKTMSLYKKVAAAAAPSLTGSVSITGTAKVGQTLTANPSLNGSGAISYVWKRGNTAEEAGTPISGATNKAYTLAAKDEDKYIRVTVDRAGNKGEITSAASAQVVASPEKSLKVTGISGYSGKSFMLGVADAKEKLLAQDVVAYAEGTILEGSLSITVALKSPANDQPWTGGAGTYYIGVILNDTEYVITENAVPFSTALTTVDVNDFAPAAGTNTAKSLTVTGIGEFDGADFVLGVASTREALLAENVVAYAEGELSGDSKTVELKSPGGDTPWTGAGAYYVGVIINGTEKHITKRKVPFFAALTTLDIDDFEPADDRYAEGTVTAKSINLTGFEGYRGANYFILWVASTTADLSSRNYVASADGTTLSASSQTVALISRSDFRRWTGSGSYYVAIFTNSDTYITKTTVRFSTALTTLDMNDFVPSALRP